MAVARVDLLDDLVGAQVAPEAQGGRRAELAVDGAADLRGHAQGQLVAFGVGVRDQHRLDGAPVVGLASAACGCRPGPSAPHRGSAAARGAARPAPVARVAGRWPSRPCCRRRGVQPAERSAPPDRRARPRQRPSPAAHRAAARGPDSGRRRGGHGWQQRSRRGRITPAASAASARRASLSGLTRAPAGLPAPCCDEHQPNASASQPDRPGPLLTSQLQPDWPPPRLADLGGDRLRRCLSASRCRRRLS